MTPKTKDCALVVGILLVSLGLWAAMFGFVLSSTIALLAGFGAVLLGLLILELLHRDFSKPEIQIGPNLSKHLEQRERLPE